MSFLDLLGHFFFPQLCFVLFSHYFRNCYPQFSHACELFPSLSSALEVKKFRLRLATANRTAINSVSWLQSRGLGKGEKKVCLWQSCLGEDCAFTPYDIMSTHIVCKIL